MKNAYSHSMEFHFITWVFPCQELFMYLSGFSRAFLLPFPVRIQKTSPDALHPGILCLCLLFMDRQMICKILFLQLDDFTAQQQQTNQVGNDHHAVDGVSQIPSKAQSCLGTNEDHTDPNQLDPKRLLLPKINTAPLSA